MRKTMQPPALLCAVLLLALTGCHAGNARAAKAPTDPPEPVEYVVVESPKGGWTTRELMSVTYFCDQRLHYPLAVKDLGEDFTLKGSTLFSEFRPVPVQLYFRDQRFANTTVLKHNGKMMIYNAVLTPQLCEVEDTEPFVINGVKMYDSYDDVIAALGDDYRFKSDTGIHYNDRETGEDLCSLFFEDGKLVHFNYSLRFDTGLQGSKDN